MIVLNWLSTVMHHRMQECTIPGESSHCGQEMFAYFWFHRRRFSHLHQSAPPPPPPPLVYLVMWSEFK